MAASPASHPECLPTHSVDTRQAQPDSAQGELEPGRREAAAALVAPPRRQRVHQLQAPTPLHLAVSRRWRGGQDRDPLPDPVSDLKPDDRAVAATVTVTTPPGTAEPLCRTELVTSSLASKSARSTCAYGSPSTLPANTRASCTCSGTAGIVTLWRNCAADIEDTDPP
jgi:hypothetical protein